MRLVTDLRRPDTGHTWMWELDPARGLRQDEFVTATLLRLGAPIAEAVSECTRCGSAMDRQCR
eukprot:8721066-Alexandrium_andersonii.AAC.1